MSEISNAVDPTEPIDKQTFGEATVRVVVDEATDERLREAYQVARDEHGSAVDDFHMFVLNHVETEHVVDVEPADDGIEASAEYDPEAETPVSIEIELPDDVDPEAALDSVDIQVADE